MKKILRITLFSLLGLILVALAGLHIMYHTFSPDDKGIPVNESNLVYFQESYDDCRTSFLDLASEAMMRFDSAELFSINVPSKMDQDLFIDLLYLPPTQESDKLLVISSGIHGVEGYTGSAVQQMFLKELISPDVLSEMGVLIIHGMNPFGFKYRRRCTENNVDLNRGSEFDPSLFKTKNEGYGTLYDMLNPQGIASSSSLRNQFFYMVAISKIVKESMSVLRQAILQGQYEYSEGIYFGGMDFEPQIDSLKRILPEYFSAFETIMALDLHTGYGARRVLHLFPNPVDDPDIKAKTEAVFEGHTIDWGDSDDFYTISGGFADALLRKMNPDATYLYMLFEWGTLDSETMFGSLESIQRIINENQGYHFGYKSVKHQQKIESTYVDMFYSNSEAWRSEVIESGRDMMNLVLNTYPEVN